MLSNNKLLNLAALNAESKAFAVKAAQSDYFPKVIGTAMYFHFNDNLGTVLATQGRHVTGPLGSPLVTFPPTVVDGPDPEPRHLVRQWRVWCSRSPTC